jgi:hypothetical protein
MGELRSPKPPCICSFDIGIKNLAFCVMAGSEIRAWENVNIMAVDEADVAPTNCETVGCKTKAKWLDAGRRSCKRHLGLPALASGAKVCTKIPTVRDLKALLGSTAAKRDTLVAEAGKRFALPIEATKKKSVLHESLSVLHDGIRRLIDGRFETFRECGTFLLENQPVLKNPTMKSVQILLFATIRDCFLGRGLPAPTMRLVHASRKTAGFVDDGGLEPVHGDAGYASRKAGGEARAIDFCRTRAPAWLATITGAKKKSDLADALCMCLDARL